MNVVKAVLSAILPIIDSVIVICFIIIMIPVSLVIFFVLTFYGAFLGEDATIWSKAIVSTVLSILIITTWLLAHWMATLIVVIIWVLICLAILFSAVFMNPREDARMVYR